MTTFSERLTEALEIRNIRSIDLANATGISEATISQYKTGYAKPKEDKLALISKALDVDPSWLLGLDVPMETRHITFTTQEIMAKRIKAKRTECGLTMKELGAKLGVGASAVNKWEKGHVTNIRQTTIEHMAELFGCSAVWLMGYDNYRLSEDEMNLISNYRNADIVAREAIKRLLDWKGDTR